MVEPTFQAERITQAASADPVAAEHTDGAGIRTPRTNIQEPFDQGDGRRLRVARRSAVRREALQRRDRVSSFRQPPRNLGKQMAQIEVARREFTIGSEYQTGRRDQPVKVFAGGAATTRSYSAFSLSLRRSVIRRARLDPTRGPIGFSGKIAPVHFQQRQRHRAPQRELSIFEEKNMQVD